MQPAAVRRVLASPKSAQLLAGAALQFAVTLQSADGTLVSGRTVQWSVEESAVATVSASGLLTTVAYLGELSRSTRVIARSEGIADTAVVTVQPVPVAAIRVTPSVGILAESDSIQLSATTVDSLGRTLTGRPLTWSSSDPTIATVSASGRVVALPYAGAVMSRSVTLSAASEAKQSVVPLQVVVDLSRSTTFFQAVPNALPNLNSYYQATAGAGALYAPLVADLNKDGRDDVVLHLWHGRTPLEVATWSPTLAVPNRLVALIANPDGSFTDRTLQLFGSSNVDLAGGTSRAVRAKDMNGDGYPDWVYALNREDQRPPTHASCPPFNSSQIGGAPLCWVNQAVAVLSNGDGTYRVVPFGFTKYHHLVEIFRAADGSWHVTFNASDYNDPGTYRYDGGNTFTWIPGYPNRGIGTMLGFSSLANSPADRFLTDSYENTVPPSVVLYGGQAGGFYELGRFQWGSYRRINFVEFGQSYPDWIVMHGGREYLTGGFWESCAMRMRPGAPVTTIVAYHTSILNASTQGRTQFDTSEPRTAWHKLLALQPQNGQLVDIGVFPASAEGPYPAYFFTCADVNADGFTDVTTSAYGVSVRPRIFLNQAGTSFTQVPESRVPAGPPYDFSYVLLDSNGDGIRDILFYPMGCNGGIHCAVYTLYRGRRRLP